MWPEIAMRIERPDSPREKRPHLAGSCGENVDPSANRAHRHLPEPPTTGAQRRRAPPPSGRTSAAASTAPWPSASRPPPRSPNRRDHRHPPPSCCTNPNARSQTLCPAPDLAPRSAPSNRRGQPRMAPSTHPRISQESPISPLERLTTAGDTPSRCSCTGSTRTADAAPTHTSSNARCRDGMSNGPDTGTGPNPPGRRSSPSYASN